MKLQNAPSQAKTNQMEAAYDNGTRQHNQIDALYVKMANLLANTQCEKDVVRTCLQLLCETFSYACGVFYELDGFQQFCEIARHGQRPAALQSQIPAELITIKDQLFWARKGIAVLEKSPKNTQQEQQLLTFMGMDCVAFAPIIDMTQGLYGFVALGDAKHVFVPSEPEKKQLQALLAMVVHAASGRVYQNKLHQSRVTMGNLLDNSGIDVYVNDLYNHDILYVNESMAAPYGGKEMFDGKKCWQVLFPGQQGPCSFCPKAQLLDAKGEPTQVYSWDYQRAFDGSWFRVFSAAFEWADGRMAHIVSSADITDNKRNEAIIENLANYDQLTKLPNRRMLLQECARRIDAVEDKDKGYVLFFDIDNFKAINDTLGHDAGDEFLIQLGTFFSEIPDLKDAIYRNGGDEFVALLDENKVSKDQLQGLSNLIHARFQKEWTLKKGNAYCGVSIGVACYPEDGKTAETLLQKADQAMYKVKKNGGGGICFGNQTAHVARESGLA